MALRSVEALWKALGSITDCVSPPGMQKTSFAMPAISSQRKTALGGSTAKSNRANSAPTIELNNGFCSTRLNDRFPVQDSANSLIRVDTPSRCCAYDGSNGGE
jgi:hypothetical protein